MKMAVSRGRRIKRIENRRIGESLAEKGRKSLGKPEQTNRNDASECKANLLTAASRQLLMFSLPKGHGISEWDVWIAEQICRERYASDRRQIGGSYLQNTAAAAMDCA